MEGTYMMKEVNQRWIRDIGEVMKAQIEILRLVAMGKPLLEILALIVEQSNQLFDELRCSILLLGVCPTNEFSRALTSG
jgi:predicted Na+-dependent transporter